MHTVIVCTHQKEQLPGAEDIIWFNYTTTIRCLEAMGLAYGSHQ
jgi:hypothetical protein